MSRLQPSEARSNTGERGALVRPLVEGRRLLDIGAAGGDLHPLLAEVAAASTVMDLDPKVLDKFAATGSRAVVADAQGFDLGETFDVIFAGELIEHLTDLGGFFDSVRGHLEPDGVLVLTTPNAFGFTNFVYRLGRGPAPLNDDHMMWFCPDTLRQLCERCGFEVVESSFVPHTTPGRIRGLMAGAIRRLLPDRLAHRTLFVVATPRPRP